MTGGPRDRWGPGLCRWLAMHRAALPGENCRSFLRLLLPLSLFLFLALQTPFPLGPLRRLYTCLFWHVRDRRQTVISWFCRFAKSCSTSNATHAQTASLGDVSLQSHTVEHLCWREIQFFLICPIPPSRQIADSVTSIQRSTTVCLRNVVFQ